MGLGQFEGVGGVGLEGVVYLLLIAYDSYDFFTKYASSVGGCRGRATTRTSGGMFVDSGCTSLTFGTRHAMRNGITGVSALITGLMIGYASPTNNGLAIGIAVSALLMSMCGGGGRASCRQFTDG